VAFDNLIWGDIVDGSSPLGWPWCRRALLTRQKCVMFGGYVCVQAGRQAGGQANKLEIRVAQNE